MDKYTVDLDKVLNDFEYSELTEHNNDFTPTTVQFAQSSEAPTMPYLQQPYTKIQISTPKHSINNVFHSLNEYLNSDIKTDLIPESSTSLNNIQEIEANIPQLPTRNERNSSIEEIFASISTKEEIPPAPEQTKSEENHEKNNNFNQIDLEPVDIVDSATENHVDVKEIDRNENSPEERIEIVEEIKFEPKTNEIEESTDTNSDLEEPNVETPQIQNNLQESEVIIVEKSLENGLDELKPTPKAPISFADIKINDTDIENELAELEEQFEVETDCESPKKSLKLELEETKTETIELVTVINDVQKTEDINTKIPENSDSDDVDSESELNSESPDLDSLKQNGNSVPELVNDIEIDSNQENPIEISSEINLEPPPAVEPDTTSVEILKNSAEVQELDVIVEKPQEVEFSEEIVEKTIEISSPQLETVTEIKIEDSDEQNVSTRRNSGLIRPNSLDLNSDQENLTITLIGDPGSTPYNNMYVENSLKPQTADQDDINNSLSPTLSETSPYENSDSPNTSDSCNDTSFEDYSNNLPAKNTNKDAETRLNNPEMGQGDANLNINPEAWLGKTAPFWTPDSEALSCLHCDKKFTVFNRRHHCRACGLVLCTKCCNLKYKLEYMDNLEARVCAKCFEILTKSSDSTTTSSGSDNSPESRGNSPQEQIRLHPNNPMDYCSTVPPHEQVANASTQPPPTVMVPVGVLKSKGSGKSRSGKSVMFCDGIRPGCDLTELDYDFNYKEKPAGTTSSTTGSKKLTNLSSTRTRSKRNLPKMDGKTSSYIPSEDNCLPPIVNVLKSDIFYADCTNNNNSMVEMLRSETITFALQRNLLVQVRLINMDCCINKQAWCFTTDGMITVGQDEIVILLEFIDNEKTVPKDIFLHLNHIYLDAVKGTTITELGLSLHSTSMFLESKNHAGFLFIKPTFQCMQNVILPKEPFMIGVLIHRWETPWAKIFPLRLLLRLGAEYRYYPSPIISTRLRESVYVEIGHTIINLLADFRNFSYTIPSVRGLTIHMEDKNTTVSIPKNRYDQVMKALNNSSDYILAFAANFSPKADSHLVCIQDTHGNNENAYTTHAINIHNKPRKVTGASFIVLNGALKSTSGLIAKSSIVEDGLMIQILPDQMVKLRQSLKNMTDFKINCGCVNAQSDESVSILWTDNDINFNIGITSPIDNMSLAGIPSIRVHMGKDYICNSGTKMIRWTEVFIIQSGEENARTQDPVDVSKISESISKATSQALVKYLELLATNSLTKIGVRATLHVENVSYSAGSNNTKLPPIYMKSLDNELIPVLHKITSNNFGDQAIEIELIFHILNM